VVYALRRVAQIHFQLYRLPFLATRSCSAQQKKNSRYAANLDPHRPHESSSQNFRASVSQPLFPPHRGTPSPATWLDNVLALRIEGCVDGFRGDHILLAPPFIISPDECSQIAQALDFALAQTFHS
jgi:hypothetical protein